jgi:hypothetical protein
MLMLVLTGHAWALSESEFIQKGKRVIAISRAIGLQKAERVFAQPGSGFVALEGPGLHVWATDASGVVIFDLSGQTTTGTDLRHWANDDGAVLMDAIFEVAGAPEGGLLARFKGIPHPKTNRLGAADFYCGRVAQGAIVCTTYTPDAN